MSSCRGLYRVVHKEFPKSSDGNKVETYKGSGKPTKFAVHWKLSLLGNKGGMSVKSNGAASPIGHVAYVGPALKKGSSTGGEECSCGENRKGLLSTLIDSCWGVLEGGGRRSLPPKNYSVQKKRRARGELVCVEGKSAV